MLTELAIRTIHTGQCSITELIGKWVDLWIGMCLEEVVPVDCHGSNTGVESVVDFVIEPTGSTRRHKFKRVTVECQRFDCHIAVDYTLGLLGCRIPQFATK